MPFLARARATRLGYPSPGVVADRGLGLAPPLACTPGTPASTAGPFYTPSTPRRASLREPESGGEPLVLQGPGADARLPAGRRSGGRPVA